MAPTKGGTDLPRIAVAIPCLNEESTVGQVIENFRRVLPGATIYVIDNASSDGTARVAEAAGAIVVREKRAGKGWAVQRIFTRVDADVVVVVDGDDTYPAEAAKELIEPILSQDADMVVGNRLILSPSGAFPRFHRLGNRMIASFVSFVFGTRIRDILSGYRAMSRRVLREIPLITRGFEIETELTIQVLERGMVIQEVPIQYRARPSGSRSKLRTFKDGYRILLTIGILLRDHRPLRFFTVVSSPFLVGSLIAGIQVLTDYVSTGILLRPVAAIISGLSLMIGVIVFLGGLILNGINTRFQELAVLLSRPKGER